MKLTHNQRGFTLIEILVVMAIITSLVSLVGGNFVLSRLRARDAQRQNDLQQVQRALELYYNDHARYPASTAGNTVGGMEWGTEFFDVNGTIFMAQLPTDPRAPSVQYQYIVDDNTNPQKYRLYARLENDENDVTDLDGDGNTGDTYDISCGGGYNCNFGLSSVNTTMEEVW